MGFRVDPGIRFIIDRRFARDPEFKSTTHAVGPRAENDDLVDFVFLTERDPHAPEEVFSRLRWGGQLVFVSRDEEAVKDAARAFATWHAEQAVGLRSGGGAWIVEQPPAMVRKYAFGLRLLGVHTRIYYFVTRKVMLVEPGRSSERFTYHVHLGRNPDSHLLEGPSGNDAYEVVKEVPTPERVLAAAGEVSGGGRGNAQAACPEVYGEDFSGIFDAGNGDSQIAAA